MTARGHVWRRAYGPCRGLCSDWAKLVVAYPPSRSLAPTVFCCECGDAWTRGWITPLPRPFKRGWRKEAVEHHKGMWREAGSGEVLYDDDDLAIPDGSEA